MKPQTTVGDLFRIYRQDMTETPGFMSDPKKARAFYDICRCRHDEEDSHLELCPECHTPIRRYHSCGNSACPCCGAADREVWIEKEAFYTLNIPYYHLVFTVPHELNPLFLLRPAFMYNLLFRAVHETLDELARDPKHLGIQPGYIEFLHTFSSTLELHPHIHVLMAGGGIDSRGRWKGFSRKNLFSMKVIKKLYKNKFLSLLKDFDSSCLEDKSQLYTLRSKGYEKEWVVYQKEKLESPKSVIEYFARYVNRTAISSSRIVQFKDGRVTFRYKGKDGKMNKVMTLELEEFVRRFMMHVLPKNFMKIRRYGFMSNAWKTERFEELRKMTNTPEPDQPRTKKEVISQLMERVPTTCPNCGCEIHFNHLE